MNNSKGSTLAIALSMVFLFAALGAGAIEYGGEQRQFAAGETINEQAFWLADAGLQQSLASNEGAILPTNFGNGSFVVNSSTSENTVTLVSTGTLNWALTTIKRTLKAVGTTTSVFGGGNALVSGSALTSGMTLNSPLTIDNYNSSGGSVSGNAQIETNATGITGSTPSGVTLTTNAGTSLPTITVPSALQTATCPGGGTYWDVTANTTWSTAGNYQCDYLYIASGVTLTITAPISLYLTATDPATGPDGTVDGEDLRGGGNANNLGYVKVLSGGSLTVYAAGRMTFGTNTPDTLNISSTVDFLNQDPWDPAIAYSTGTYVTYNDEAWISIKAGTNQTPATGSTYWSLVNYLSTTSYALNAYVTYNGGAWRSTISNNLNNTPSSSSTDWILSNNPIPADIIIYSLYQSPAAWNSATTYSLDDLVTYANAAFQSGENNNLDNMPGSSGTTYPAWSSTTTYSSGTDVTYNSETWQSQANNNTGNTPGASTAYANWSNSTIYASGADVTYNGGAWQSQQSGNQDNIPGAAPTYAPWSNRTTYSTGQFVTYNGEGWESEKNNNRDNTPGTGSTYWKNIVWWTSTTQNTVWWQSVTVSAPWDSIAWSSTTDYSVGSTVYYNGLIWQSVKAGSGQAPSAGSSYWNSYAGVEVDNDGKHFYGLIYAPNSLIFINTSETISGAVVGNMVNVQSNSVVNYDQALETTTNSSFPMTFTLTSWKECPPSIVGTC